VSIRLSSNTDSRWKRANSPSATSLPLIGGAYGTPVEIQRKSPAQQLATLALRAPAIAALIENALHPTRCRRRKVIFQPEWSRRLNGESFVGASQSLLL
jgi:hypothetical protein